MNRPVVTTTTKYYLIMIRTVSTNLYKGEAQIKFSLGILHIHSSLGQKKPL